MRGLQSSDSMKVLPSDVQPVTLDVKEDESLLVLDRLSGVNSGIADAGPNLRGEHCPSGGIWTLVTRQLPDAPCSRH